MNRLSNAVWASALFLGVGVCSPCRGVPPVRVRLADADWHVARDAGPNAKLRAALLRWYTAWLSRDLRACHAVLDPDVLRAMPDVPEVQSGREAVLAGLPREWSAFEQTAAGDSALTFVLRDVRAQREGDAALLHFHASITGGTRWTFEDASGHAVLFRRSGPDGDWRLVFETAAMGITLDREGTDRAQDDGGFAYDYAMPVRDLARAMRFYQPLLGAPEAVVGKVAAYQLNGSRLFLDGSGAAPASAPRRGLPNGWPIVIAHDPQRAQEAAEAAGLAFADAPQNFGGHRVRFGFEPGGNLIALALAPVPARHETRQALQIAAALMGRTPPAALAQAERALHADGFGGDAATLQSPLAPRAAVLDASQPQASGWSQGRPAADLLAAALPRNGKVRLSAAHIVSAGPWWVFVRQRTTVGPAPWNRQAQALHALVYDSRTARVALSLTAAAARPTALAIDFDYAGIPATAEQWSMAAAALRGLTGDPETYTDTDWLGLWGDRAVLGLFTADPDVDGMPRPQAASTYLSLWVSDINAALAYARNAGASLPVVPAINEQAGIDRQPGYAQVYLSDSEGNGLVLTEYSGRSR